MKKLLILGSILITSIAFARPPHGGPGFHHGGFGLHPAPHFRPAPPPPHYHHSYWGPGGRNFWPGFVGGVIGSTIVNSLYTTPSTVVVSQPVYVPPQRVWVAGHYETRYDTWGRSYQVWIPGYWR